MNEEQKELNTGRPKQKNVKIFAGSENFQGGHKKGFTRKFSHQKVWRVVLRTRLRHQLIENLLNLVLYDCDAAYR